MRRAFLYRWVVVAVLSIVVLVTARVRAAPGAFLPDGEVTAAASATA